MKFNYSNRDVFILSSICKIVKGFNRSILIDYLRGDVRIISNQYADLISLLNRKKINSVINLIEKDSIDNFNEFLVFMLTNEFAFLTESKRRFPEISSKINDEDKLIKDTIIEVDCKLYNSIDFGNIINKINNINCAAVQIRFLYSIDIDVINQIIACLRKTNINYVELHIEDGLTIDQNFYLELIKETPILSRVYLYNSIVDKKHECFLESDGYIPLLMGTLFLIKDEMIENCCGHISFHNLDFNDINLHNVITKFNGCLYKKVTIDKDGQVKNCPSIKNSYGHYSKVDIRQLIKDEKFNSLWKLKKDDIKVCMDCEFRYNCTDCRAFLTDESDIKSKPLKCGYNPYTNVWEDSIYNPLKND